MMTDQLEERIVNNTLLLENRFSVKKEECQNDDVSDENIDISETAIIIGNSEVQDQSLPDTIKQYDLSTTLDNVKVEEGITTLDNVKVEEGISLNDIKVEFNNGFLYCENCQVYCEDYCTECGMLVRILNRMTLIKTDSTQEELPNNNILEFQDYLGEFHILALKAIPAGVTFGPFTGFNRTNKPWKLKGGKFVVDRNKSKHLNWMQYINYARNISEQNLLVFQYENNLYYRSTRLIREGDELLVYLGEKYEESMNKNVEMDFVPTTESIFKDVFACTFCCFGFSSKSYLVKHKTICPLSADRGFSIKELMQCPSCQIHLDQKEYFSHHMAYCYERDERKCILPTSDNETSQVDECKTRPRLIYKCQECKYSTKYKGDLKNHTNRHHEVKMYKCGVCCRRFKTKEVLRLHVENTRVCAGVKEDWGPSTGDNMNEQLKAEHSYTQDESIEFKCPLCEFPTKSKINLKRHMKAKHAEGIKYKCGVCNFTTRFKSSLKAHTAGKHLKEYKYKCDRCDYKANQKAHLKSHIDTRHLKEYKYKCDTCDYKTYHKSYLKSHMKGKHLNEFKYKCDKCSYRANHKSQLNTHMETRHLKEFRYKCDVCDYKANLKCQLKAHKETKHLKEFKYKCDICDYRTNFKFSLKGHTERKHLKEFKYKCDTCDYKANVKSCLKRHVEIKHLKELKYKCDSCDYITYIQASLKRHTEVKHLKQFKYKCDSCDYKANIKANLKRHIDVKHLKKIIYKCDRCDYTTTFKNHLKIHVEGKHSKDFIYKCGICDYTTNWKSYLKTHIEARHLKGFKYKCDKCDYKTNLKLDLKRHVKGKHLEQFQ